MSARGQLPWTGSAGRSREIGYADAMRAVWALVRDLRAQALNQAAADIRDREAAGYTASCCPCGAEQVASRVMAALRLVDEYAEAACLLAEYPAVTIDNGVVLDGGFYQTWMAMFGESGGAS